MLKRYFIPVIVVLLALAVAVYFLAGHSSTIRDVRAAVPVEHFRLSNGLNVVVMPNDRIPLVTHMLIVKAGAADDPYGKSGLAHYLEHLMFSGTKNFPEGMYERAIGRVGGAQNAYTTRDYTLYFSTVAKEHLPAVMTMEADRLMNREFEPAAVARELKVITEERNMRVDNNPASQWMEQLDALTFLNHPYGQPTIGWAEDMASFTAADAQDFFTRHYRASNMILLVAGDVTARDVRRMAQRYYGALSAGDTLARDWPKEPPARMARRGEMRDARVNEPRLLRQYVAPSAVAGTTAQAMPLAVFAQYLGGGDASVLYTALVREQKLATSVRVTYDALSIGPALLRIHANPATGVSLEQLEAALDRELSRILAGPLDTHAMARAKTMLVAEATFAQDGLQGLASVMAEIYANGLDEQYFYEWARLANAVTEDAALSAARAVMVPKASVTGYLLPEQKPAAAPTTAPAAPAPATMTEAPNAL
jgi:zinc protease